jgi:hypothetical protein
VLAKAPKPPRTQISSEEPVKRPGRVSSNNPKPQPIPSPSAFPRIDASTQKYRDNDSAAILDEERRKEAALTDKTSIHTSQSDKLFSRLNLTAFASIRNAICAEDGARNDNSPLKTGPICVLGSVGQHLSRTHLSA